MKYFYEKNYKNVLKNFPQDIETLLPPPPPF